MTHRWRLLILGVASLFVASLTPTAAHAELESCGAAGSYFDGYGYGDGPSGYVGTAAAIKVQHSALCQTDTNPGTNFSYTWTMIANFDGESGYAQSGYFHGYGQAIKHAVEDNPTGSAPVRRTYIPGAVVGDYYAYSVVYTGGSCSCILERIANTTYQQTNFHPYNRWQWPWTNEWFGETKYKASDVAGYVNNKAEFASLDVQDTTDGFIGHAYENYGTQSNPRGQRSAWSSSSFSIWSS